MSLTIQFMYNNEPMNKINKTPEAKFSLTGVLKEESSIVDPVVLIEKDSPIEANYAYIEAFARYYYIKDITCVRSGLWRISMHTDVLKTFSEGILDSPCIVAKSSSKFNLYLNDSDYKCTQCDLVFTKDFPSGFNLANATYALAALGDREAVASS